MDLRSTIHCRLCRSTTSVVFKLVASVDVQTWHPSLALALASTSYIDQHKACLGRYRGRREEVEGSKERERESTRKSNSRGSRFTFPYASFTLYTSGSRLQASGFRLQTSDSRLQTSDCSTREPGLLPGEITRHEAVFPWGKLDVVLASVWLLPPLSIIVSAYHNHHFCLGRVLARPVEYVLPPPYNSQSPAAAVSNSHDRTAAITITLMVMVMATIICHLLAASSSRNPPACGEFALCEQGAAEEKGL